MSNELQIVISEKNLLRKFVEEPDQIVNVDDAYFVTDTGKHLYKALYKLYNEDRSLNYANLAKEVNNFERLSLSNVQSLTEHPVPRESVETLYQDLRAEHLKESIQEEIQNNLYADSTSKAPLDLDKTQESIIRIQSQLEDVLSPRSTLFTYSDMLDDYQEQLEKRRRGESSYDTGCSFLNRYLLEGFFPQKITTIFGPSGVGKSTFALYLVNRQINKRIPALYVSLEMDKFSTMDRLIAQRQSIPISDLHPNTIRSGDEDLADAIPQYVFDAVEQERKKLRSTKRFRFVEEPGLSLADIEYLIQVAKKQMGVDYLIVTIDLLTMLKDFNKSDNKPQDYEEAMNLQHQIARRNNVHFVNVVQARRPQGQLTINTVEDVEKYRPKIEQIKNSGALEERSRIILATFRKKHFVQRLLPDAPELIDMDDIMDVDIMKQNMGQLRRLKYLTFPETAQLFQYESEVEDIDTGE